MSIREQIEKANNEGMGLNITYDSGEHRSVEHGRYRLVGDKLIVEINGQRPASIHLWGIESVSARNDLFNCPPLIRRQCMVGNRRHGCCTHEIQGTVLDCPLYQQKSS